MAPWWNPERRQRRRDVLNAIGFLVCELTLIALVVYALAVGAWMAR